jgi:hypothetical protein
MAKLSIPAGFVALSVVAGPVICSAQTAPAPPMQLRVTVTQVKPEMINEWIDLQKSEVAPALKKAGVKSRTVYSSGLFGTAGEYVLISPIEKWADFDAGNPLAKALGPEGAARLGEKLRKCVMGSHSYLITRLADLSNVTQEPPAMIISTRIRVPPNHSAEFQNLVKTEILPVYKKANVSFLVSSRGLGGNPSDVTLSSGLNKFADMEGGSPLVKALGQEGFQKLAIKATALGTVIDQVLRVRVNDLSF